MQLAEMGTGFTKQGTMPTAIDPHANSIYLPVRPARKIEASTGVADRFPLRRPLSERHAIQQKRSEFIAFRLRRLVRSEIAAEADGHDGDEDESGRGFIDFAEPKCVEWS
jgi:hypothetical protein